MGFFSSDSSEAQAYDEYNGKHKTDISHQLLAGAASFVAAREYEKHVAANGKPTSHAEAKELLYVLIGPIAVSDPSCSAGFAGAFIDREVETHGLDFVDKEKAKYEAHKAASDRVKEVDYS
ncbi:hypothetical protein C8F01DRAFT_1119726 [Mycena amicta]|nr:hypothetical protein C8F01DRAFT_1119726 [Mycena amicta]